MRNLLTVAAAALALSLSAGASFAVPADNQDDNTGFLTDTAPTTPDTTFDLGIDVGGVANTPIGVKGFLGSLAPETQRVIETTCEHYMENPQAVRDGDTLAFCAVVVGS